MIGTFVFSVERRDICFLCGEKGHWARNCPKKQQQYKADWTEAGMEEREEPAILNRERGREEHLRHPEGECTTPTQTLIIDVKDFVFLEKKDACFEKRWFRESCVKEHLTLSCMLMNERRCAVSVILLKSENKSFSQFLHRCSKDALLFWGS